MTASLLPIEDDPNIPPGSVVAAEVLVTQYILPSGRLNTRTYYQGDTSLTQILGLLVAAAINIYGRAE